MPMGSPSQIVPQRLSPMDVSGEHSTESGRDVLSSHDIDAAAESVVGGSNLCAFHRLVHAQHAGDLGHPFEPSLVNQL